MLSRPRDTSVIDVRKGEISHVDVIVVQVDFGGVEESDGADRYGEHVGVGELHALRGRVPFTCRAHMHKWCVVRPSCRTAASARGICMGPLRQFSAVPATCLLPTARDCVQAAWLPGLSAHTAAQLSLSWAGR